jgi:flagella basal body P-ring formation protein FlgA
MIRALALALATLCLAAPALAQTTVTVRGDWVSLGDVASAAGVEISAEAAAALVSPAPPPGQRLALDPAFVAGVARSSGVEIQLPAEPIWVTRAAAASPTRASAPAPRPAAAAAAPTQVLVLTRDIPRGQAIEAGDLDWQAPVAGRSVRGLPADPDAIAGQVAKRNLRNGQMIYASDYEAPAVIRRGEAVRIIYARPGLRLTVDGVAQADASVGETVRIVNNSTRRSIDAVATAEGEARVSAN